MQEKIIIREVAAEDVMLAIGKTNALKELKQKLGLRRLPVVIEGFDISNISGILAVGSMVCFRNAQPDKPSYRKFKIKTVAGPDDFAMIKEVVYRRYKRLLDEKSKFPDLIVIDGGRGQLSAATEILDKLGVNNTPIISLAKQHEEIFIPGRQKPTPALHVLERVRDEAHRFALSYHHNRRKNKLIIGK
jgi:excinuclease ABC subunit C